MTQSSAKKSPPKKRMSKHDREALDDLKERGLVGRDNPGNRNAEYSEMRSRPGIYPDQVAHPGFEDERYNHRQKEFSHVDVGPLESVFTALTNENYRLGGWPKWIIKTTSQLDRHIYERVMYRQGTFDGYCNESTRKIARAIGATGDAVQRSIRHMVKLGLLVEVYHATGKTPAYYQTKSPWELEPPTGPLEPRRKSNFHTINQEQKDPTARPSVSESISEKEPTEITNEPTARPSRADRADGQKTKTTVEVREGVASAPSLLTSRKIERPQTFPELHAENKSKRLAEQESRRPKVMGAFSYDQMSEEKIKGYIDANLTLAQLLTSCLERSQNFCFYPKTGEIGPLPGLEIDEAYILDFISFCMTDPGSDYDLRYPEKAIHVELLELEKSYIENFDRAKDEQLEWNYRMGNLKRPPRDIP